MSDDTYVGRTPVAIGHRLAITRQAIGLSQVDFARKAGIAANTYNQYETGASRPSLDNAVKICDAHRLSLDWIYLGEPGGLSYALADAIRAIRQSRGGTATL